MGQLEEAVAAFRAALIERTRERMPFDWAATQSNLGTALALLGERKSGEALIEEAIAAFRAALTEWTRERAPLEWAIIQKNLGNALLQLVVGRREGFEEAYTTFREALKEEKIRGPIASGSSGGFEEGDFHRRIAEVTSGGHADGSALANVGP